LNDLNDLGGEIEIRDTHRAALAISAQVSLIARAEGDVREHACIFSEHTLT